MKALRRNKQKIYYANRIGSFELTDEFGDGTGEMLPEYTEAKPIYCNVSASRGIADSEIFGINKASALSNMLNKETGKNNTNRIKCSKEGNRNSVKAHCRNC